MEMNLDARARRDAAPAAGAPIDFADPTTYNNATSLTVYDAKGQDVALTYYFQKAATDTWNVYVDRQRHADRDRGRQPGAVDDDHLPGQRRHADRAGRHRSRSTSRRSPTPSVRSRVPITGVALDVSGATQYGSQFGVTDLAQDGYAPGQLIGVAVRGQRHRHWRATRTARRKPAGQIEIATFRNPQGLQPLGGNAWARTFASGDPIVGVPGDGNLGVLQAGALEESNVDLTAELVNMITAQRVYQANAQTIKTQDQILQTIVNLR